MSSFSLPVPSRLRLDPLSQPLPNSRTKNDRHTGTRSETSKDWVESPPDTPNLLLLLRLVRRVMQHLRIVEVTRTNKAPLLCKGGSRIVWWDQWTVPSVGSCPLRDPIKSREVPLLGWRFWGKRYLFLDPYSTLSSPTGTGTPDKTHGPCIPLSPLGSRICWCLLILSRRLLVSVPCFTIPSYLPPLLLRSDAHTHTYISTP